MENQIEIRLTEIQQQAVHLNALTADAFDSFFAVTSSLKAIATAVVGSENLTFSIQEGSALCTLSAPFESLDLIHKEVNLAISGQSRNKDVTDPLRKIQEQMGNEAFGYEFLFKAPQQTYHIHNSLKEARRISISRSRSKYHYHLQLISGVVNQIGGNNPNYHFDHGGGSKTTVDCKQEDAIEVNQFLYKKISSLVLVKKTVNSDRNTEYIHRTIVDSDLTSPIQGFLGNYNAQSDLVEQLVGMHAFVATCLLQADSGLKVLKALITAFNDSRFHLSEVKTLLVISKPFKDHPLIQVPRLSLFETYQQMKAK